MSGDVARISRAAHRPLPVRPKVLAVSSNVPSLAFLHAILEGMGLNVLPCPQYETALEFLERVKVDLVILNQGTHAFEGRRLLEHMKNHQRDVPVLIITHRRDKKVGPRARHLGALDYLEGPVDLLEFTNLIQRRLNSRAGGLRAA